MSNIQVLLLAAGASRRMNEPKQLLPWGNVSVIEHQIKNLAATGKSVSVVLGANADKISELIDDLPVNILINKDWNTGMGSSIAYGVQQLLEEDTALDAILISLIDQPLITTDHYNKMLRRFDANKKHIIVSSSDKGWSGAPVLFDKVYFGELLAIKGDDGAKVVTNKHRDSVVPINGKDMLADMDTHEAYRQLLDRYTRMNP